MVVTDQDVEACLLLLDVMARDDNSKNQKAAQSNEAVTRSSITKLVAFSLALVLLPIAIYFISLDGVYSGNSTYAAITAAVTANVVLISYVAMAIYEDDETVKHKADKKSQ
ncbi:hypothetical protein E3P99_04098 [Wallemia hederae]|uniref:Vacuolar ATPase assembly integral membrane protein VMA21 n=1 Tax=Wallemia hederae TaxID=1540922 RepID=A0A4T0FD84_9BASI|nr:hypothetical protein E3P99_04098 [Wallemia hederae]